MPQIDYSKIFPSGQGQNVQARIDFDTGEEAIAAQITKQGEQLASLGIGLLGKLQDAEDSVELDTLRRQDIERESVLRQQLEQSRDFDANKKLIDEWTKQTDSSVGKNERVQAERRKYLNQYVPSTRANLDLQNIKTKQQSILDDSRLNMNAAAEQGDIEGYKSQIAKQLQAGLITKTQADYQSKSAPAEVALAQATRLSYGQTPADLDRASKILDGIDNSLLDEKQVRFVRNLKAELSKKNEVTSDAIENEVLFTMAKMKDAPYPERQAYADKAMSSLKASGISPERAGVMLDKINSFADNMEVKTDKAAYSQAYDKIAMLDNYSTSKQKDEVRKFLIDSKERLSVSDYTELWKKVDDRFEKTKAAAINDSVDLAVQRGRLTKGIDDADYRDQLEKMTREGNLSPEEVRAKGASLALSWKKTIPMLDEEKVQQGLGALSAGQTKPGLLGMSTKFLDIKSAVDYVKTEFGIDAFQRDPRLAEAVKKLASEKNWDTSKYPELYVKKTLSKDEASAILKEAGGDAAKARKIASDRGYKF